MTPNIRLRIATLAILAAATACSDSSGTSGRSPEETVDAYYQALRDQNPALALSLLSREVQVFEHGRLNRSREDYAAAHLPTDLDSAKRITRELLSRRSGGAGDLYWVSSTYREQQMLEDGEKDSNATETVLLRRRGETWQIVHIHFSADREIVLLPPKPVNEATQ